MAFTRRETALLVVVDFLILIVSLWVALLLRNLALPASSYFFANLTPFLPIFLLSLVVFYVAGLYEKQTRPIKRVMGMRVFGAQTANVLIAALLFFALPLTIAPKTILAIYLVVSVAAISSWRFWYITRETKVSARIPALLVASGPAAREVFEEVNSNRRYLFSFIEHIDPSHGPVREAIHAALARGARVVVLDTHDAIITRELPSLYGAMIAGVSFLEFSSFYEDVFDHVPLAHVDHAWLLERLPTRHAFYDGAKRAFDLVFGLICFIIAIPFILLAVLVLLFLGGRPFVTHERIGKGGRTFRIVKLRTMLFDDHGDPELQKRNRVTSFGRFLRMSRIDELPQLTNVLAGDLSFIGPRPELPAIAAVYDREIPYYQARHLVPPGLSGWAQLYDHDAPRGAADVERTKRKLSYDLYYLKHRSFGLDLAIALKTARALLAFSGNEKESSHHRWSRVHRL